MTTVNLLDTNVIAAYNNADSKGKQLLKDLVDGQVNFDQKITDRVKSFEDACKVLKLNASSFFSGDEETPDEVAYIKLKVIIKALNEGWTPNWNNGNEPKYWPWWNMQNGFQLYYVYYYYTGSLVGSRLCFKSRELAEYASKQFIDLYKDFLTI